MGDATGLEGRRKHRCTTADLQVQDHSYREKGGTQRRQLIVPGPPTDHPSGMWEERLTGLVEWLK
jgi:hypothetical protein